MKYVASYSGGKDSTATIILAHENDEPLDEIVFSEVMYSKTMSGELPEHIDFIKNVAFPLFNSWGYATTILHSAATFTSVFNHVITHPRKNQDAVGKIVGFPMAGGCIIQSSCKVKPIQSYFSGIPAGQLIEYVGITIDEQDRLEGLKAGKHSLLAKYGYTSIMAKDKAAQYGLLSPSYEYCNRNGCWFCPNATRKELKFLRENHYEYWKELQRLEKIPNKAGMLWDSRRGRSICNLEEEFAREKT